MAKVRSMDSERLIELENSTVVGGTVNAGGNLILTTKGGGQLNAGYVKGEDANVTQATLTDYGIVRFATASEANNTDVENLAVTPKGARAAALTIAIQKAYGAQKAAAKESNDYGPGYVTTKTYRSVGTAYFYGSFVKEYSKMRLRMVGGGGAGGGTVPVSAGYHCSGGGGGAGGYAEIMFDLDAIKTNPNLDSMIFFIIVGAGGAGVAGGNGGGGKATIFGDYNGGSFINYYVANGGYGGTVGQNTNLGVVRAGGAGASAEVNNNSLFAAHSDHAIYTTGETGRPGIGSATLGNGGAGGSSQFGAGAADAYIGAGGGRVDGNDAPGQNYGSGGGGASANANASTNGRGGAGAQGFAILEFYGFKSRYGYYYPGQP